MNIENKKPYLIATSCDRKYGDFLIEHWHFSLQKNVDLSKIDILVLDYGLSKAQSFYLKNHNVLLKECKKDGHVVNLRFRDLLDFLNQNFYEQILICDGGDIIFQADISRLFEENTGTYRVVCERIGPFFEYFITPEYFYKEDIPTLKETLLFNRTINAGFIIAPYEKFKLLCNFVIQKTKDMSNFGPDQILINYLLYKEGFVELPVYYNFIPVTSNIEFEIKNGFFYDENGNLIPVVHNAGNLSFFRAIENFGYGEGYNILKKDVLITLRAFYTSIHIMNKPRREILKAFKKIENYFINLTEQNRIEYATKEREIKKTLNIIKKFRSLK